MKTKHIKYSNIIKLEKELDKIQTLKYKSLLVQVYSGVLDKKILKKILKKIKAKLPDAVIIGASTAGEINKAKVTTDKISINFSTFKHTKLKAAYSTKTTKESAKEIIPKIDSKNIKAAILLSNGLEGEHQDFLQEFNEYKKDLIISGGLAGDNFNLKETFIIFDTKIYTTGSLAVSFSGKKLFADNKYTLSWHPIGKEMYITKVDGTKVYEIDNQPAAKVYEKYLGSSIFNNMPNSLLEFQLLFEEGNTTVARTPMAKDGDTLIFAAPIKEGQKVQFGFSNAQSLLGKANNLQHEIVKKPAQTIFAFSCVARKALLNKYLNEEIKYFENIAPTIGFITYGEYYKTDKSNALLNCTTTLLILSEKNNVHKLKNRKTDEFFQLGKNTFDSLLYFVNQTTKELNEHLTLLEQYKKAVDTSLLVSKTDLNGVITYVNDNFVKVSGYSKSELIGQKHNIVKHRNNNKKLFKNMWKTITAGKIWRGVIENISKYGKSYFVDATILPIFNDEKEIVEYMAIRQDITKQIRHQERIKASEAVLQAIFDNQESIVIYTSNIDGILNVNKRFFEMFDFKDLEDFKKKHRCICELFIDEDGYISPTSKANWLEFTSNRPDEKHKVKMRDKFGKVRIFSLKVNTFGLSTVVI